MGYERDKAFEVEDGLVLNDLSHLTSGDSNPSVAYPSPNGQAFYIETTTGRLWTWKNGGPWKIETNFSFTRVEEIEAVTIQAGEQMVFSDHLLVLGHLQVCGAMIDVSARKPEQFLYPEIPSGDTVAVWDGRLLLYHETFRVRGHLRVLGEVRPV
jgi:hypothetical protein